MIVSNQGISWSYESNSGGWSTITNIHFKWLIDTIIWGSWNGLINFETRGTLKGAIPCRKKVTLCTIVCKLLACRISQSHALCIAHVYRIGLVTIFWNPFGSYFSSSTILICLKQLWPVVVGFYLEVNSSCEDFIFWKEACFECDSIWWWDSIWSCWNIKNGE